MKITVAVLAMLVLAGCDAPADARRVAEREKAEQRFKAGAHIAQTKKLSATEELSIVIVPSSLHETLDVKCLVYKNTTFRQAIMQCPEARQQDLDVEEQ